MATNGLSSALTLSQAAKQAGLSEAEFIEQLQRRGIEVTESERAAALDSDQTVRAD